jgi:hypothetical protein
MIREVLLRSPVVVVKGDPRCRCGYDKGDARHDPVEECFGGIAGGLCADPSAHHAYRAASWRDRVRAYSPWQDMYL